MLIAAQRQFVQGLATQRKSAGLGGEGDDTQFAKTFSALAHTAIREKAPTLMDYEVGFQVLDRTENNSRAAGVVAFRVGEQSLLAPIFFLRGQRKGTELLYLKDQDTFVPLKENWINRILNRKTSRLGTGAKYDVGSLGIRQPDLSQLNYMSMKTSSAAPSAADIAETLTKLATTDLSRLSQVFDEVQELVSFPRWLSQMDKRATDRLSQMVHAEPALLSRLVATYGADAIDSAIKTAEAKLPPSGGDLLLEAIASMPVEPLFPKRAAELERLTASPNEAKKPFPASVASNLTDDEKVEFLRTRQVIRDNRADASVSALLDDDAVYSALVNPTEPGVYNVLLASGEVSEYLVLFGLLQPQSAITDTVLLSTGKKNGEYQYKKVNRRDVFVVDDPGAKQKMYDWLKEKPEVSGADMLDSRRDAIVITQDGQVTDVFSVYAEAEDDGAKVYAVRFDAGDCCVSRTSTAEPKTPIGTRDAEHDQTLHIGPVGSAVHSLRGKLFVPGDARALYPLVAAPRHELKLGDIGTVQSRFMHDTRPLRISKPAADKFDVDDRVMDHGDAVWHLVAGFGLRKDSAEHVLAAATRAEKTWRVKLASNYDPQNPDANRLYSPSPSAADAGGDQGNFMQFRGETQVPYEREDVAYEGMRSRNPSGPSNDVVDRTNELPQGSPGGPGGWGGRRNSQSDNGQPTMVDTAPLVSLLRAVGDDTIIDQAIPSLLLALDKLGRILFSLYWHGDVFAERYGKSDMPELEDALRNTYERLGDLTIFLLERSVQPYPEETDMRAFDLVN